jgi:hypothetical protein
MSDDSQIVVPPSFVALFVPPGRLKPVLPREQIAERHELCEDLAQMLVETAQAKRFELGITEDAVGGVVDAAVARWVTHRLAELLEWPQPVLDGDAAAAGATG